MKSLKTLWLSLCLLMAASASAQSQVYDGEQVMAESEIVSGNAYLVYYVGNGNSGYMKDTGTAYTGKDDSNPMENAEYVFTSNGDGTWSVKNAYTGKYWGKPTSSANTYIGEDTADTAGSWTLNFQSNNNIAPSCNGFSWNRTGSNLHPYTQGTANVNQLRIYKILDGVSCSVIQGNQTTGKGNTMQALLRVKGKTSIDFTPTTVTITMTGTDQLDKVAVYTTAEDEIRAAGVTPVKIGEVSSPVDGPMDISLGGATTITAGTTFYLWITVDVKTDATEWATIDASIQSIDYSDADGGGTLDLSAIGEPEGEMRIYKSQTTLWTSTKSGTKYYRIPALLKTGTNTLLAFTDDRYTDHGDLGNHKIDVLVKKSTDGGVTWGDAVTVAEGDGSSDAGYGYGDAAVAQAANGDIVCLMAAGKQSFPGGMLHIGFTKSSDGGTTWSTPVDIYDNTTYLTNPHATGTTTPFNSTFVSSGHGITQSVAHSGRIAFPALGRINPGTGNVTNEYVFYSDDNGATWTFTDNYGYAGADESKLLELNDGKLLMSIRTGGFNSSNVARGYNRTTDTDVENWGTQGTWSDLTANGCNSDLIYHNRSTVDPDRPDVMLHSVVKSYSNGHRKDLRLYMSFDQGTTWKEAFQLQPGWAAYSSMQVLDNGDLAILFEDGSIGNEDESDCYDINYVVISKEVLEEKINELVEVVEDEDIEKRLVKIAYGTTDPSTYGGWGNAGWHQSGTSNTASGIVGLSLASSYSEAFNRASGVYEKYVLALKVSKTNATDNITITAPNGYNIIGYQFNARSYNSNKDYTLTAGETTLTTNSSSWQTFRISGLNSQSATFTVTTAQDQTNYLCISDFTVCLVKEGIILTDVKVSNSDATAYGNLANNTWTSKNESGLEGLRLTTPDMKMTTPTAWSCTVLGLKVNKGNGATGTLTLEAPAGYLIAGYQAEVQNWSEKNNFTLTPVEGTGSATTVTDHSEPTSIKVTDINSNLARLRITATTQTNPVCFRKLIVTLYNTLKSSKTITYAIVDDEGNIVTQVENVDTYLGYAPVLPISSIDKRPWCTYEDVFYRDASCTTPVEKIYSTISNVYSRFSYDGPFEFSTEEDPKWYLIYSRKKDDATTNYFANKSGTAFNTTSNANTESLFDDTKYHWAFIGNPYNVKVKNRDGGYLAASATTAATNESEVTSAITTDNDRYPYNTFSLYGFTKGNSNVTNTTTPFALALNGSGKKTWVDGANLHRLLYHGNITVNDALQISNWSSANWEAVAVPESYPLSLSPINGKSYATLYLPYGITLPGDVTAYKIRVSGEWAVPTSMGQELPANTAALLVSESGVTSASATLNSSASADATGNALLGVLTATSGEDLKGYVLNIVGGELGFFKLDDGGTLAANRAYLPASVVDETGVKGVVLNWDEETRIGELKKESMEEGKSSTLFDLSGRRISAPSVLPKGIYIVNGKKVVIK